MLDRKALEELFDYTTYTWAVFGNSVRALPPQDFTRAVPGSGWPSMRDALFHIASAWDGWVREQSGSDFVIPEAPQVTSWDALNDYRTTVRDLLRRALDDADEAALHGEQLDIDWTTLTRGEIVAHILTHDLRHHGDVTTLLSQLGAEPPPSDYGVYRFFKGREQPNA